MGTPNQANFQTGQNFTINIEKIYSDFIQEIDVTRSLVNIQKSIALDKLNEKTVNDLNRFLKIEDTPQESRIHCFYRLIGFPVVRSDKTSYYNPGFDNIPGQEKTITLDKKIEIANDPLPDFKDFSTKREAFINYFKVIWSIQPATITASAVALSSSIHTRPFNAPLTNDKPFEFALDTQSYTADFRSIIGKNDKVSVTDYVDAVGNKPDKSALTSKRSHRIKPFIVDARIDFSCNPASRKVAVPFVLNKSNLLIAENTFVKRPLLEKVIRDRLTVHNVKDVSSAQQKIQDFILSVPSIENEPIIKQMQSDIYNTDQKVQFQKYLYIIGAMCKELVTAQLIMKGVQSRYYWLPLPSVDGPEGGSEVAPLIISKTMPDGDNNSFITTKDRELIRLTLIQAANEFNAQTAPVSGTPDPGDFTLGAIQSFDSDSSPAFGDKTQEEVKRLTKARNHDLKKANAALRTVEIIMGEFSGLGLCDIIAVMGALYVMPLNALIGFLDSDAYDRMIVSLNLEAANFPKGDIQTAQTEFVSRVKDFYNLMDDIYKNLDKNNGLSA